MVATGQASPLGKEALIILWDYRTGDMRNSFSMKQADIL